MFSQHCADSFIVMKHNRLFLIFFPLRMEINRLKRGERTDRYLRHEVVDRNVAKTYPIAYGMNT
ncbi:CLUMA_CG011004, isoform A [Clunio marinus]|uniref:CLUMA_CG011004, isoform A n=1 Tax=Clunio marinus TaxID=568069 RepID=A0A1J1ICZ3_9DIPT|nr:CLUMA_CG011004, isoform A [Clunio marinus]